MSSTSPEPIRSREPPGASTDDGDPRYRLALLAAFLCALGLSLVGAPAGTLDLTLHHVPTAVFVAWLCLSHRRKPFDNLSYSLIFVFLLIHVVGARYLYSNVPYEDWSEALIGVRPVETFDFSRNHYDRFVHLSFGLLMVHPGRLIFERRTRCSRAMALSLAVGLVIVCGTVYELIELLVAVVTSPETAENYNGQQGDVWDAQKDMAIALLGAVVAAVIEGLWTARRPQTDW